MWPPSGVQSKAELNFWLKNQSLMCYKLPQTFPLAVQFSDVQAIGKALLPFRNQSLGYWNKSHTTTNPVSILIQQQTSVAPFTTWQEKAKVCYKYRVVNIQA